MLTRKKLWYSLGGIAVLTVFCALVVWPRVPGNNSVSQWFSNWKFHLGLDLQGGTHLVYQADTLSIPAADRADALNGVRDVLERRINVFGVSEPVVQTNKVGEDWRVIIELPGVKDVNKAIANIGETPILEFKEQNTTSESEDQEQVEAAAESALKQILVAPKDFDSIARAQQDSAAATFTQEDYKFKDELPQALADTIWNYPAGKITPQIVAGNDGYMAIDSQVVPMDGFFIAQVIDKKTGVERQNNQEKEVQASHILISYKGAQSSPATRSKKEAQELAAVIDQKAKESDSDFSMLAKANSDDPSVIDNAGELGFFTHDKMTPAFADAAFSMEKGQVSDVIETEFGFHIIKVTDVKEPSSSTTIEDQIKYSYLFYQTTVDPWKATGLSGKNLKSATVEFDSTTGQPRVALNFDDEGKQLFADITTRNVGKPVAIFLDGQSISQPTVEESITDGSAVISGRFTNTEANQLAQRLRAGALPVPISLLSQQNVGPSLGKISLDKSLYAGIIGIILVAIFMLLYYRFPGLLAVLALAVYGLLNLTIFETLPVTLTLAGIAGFILSIGMAVDANVLIFERFKEERRAGKPISEAVSEGFHRAWPSIRDGNVSTLITCVILYYFGSSLIRGFGLTLGIGVLTSMFTAITVTRVLMLLTVETPLKKWDWLWGVRKNKNL